MKRHPLKWAGGMHWTSAGRSWLGLVASLRDGRFVLRHELEFQREPPELAGGRIAAFLKARGIEDCLIATNQAIWPGDDTRGESIAETFQGAGVALERGTDDAINGLSRIRSLLAVKTWPVVGPDGTARTVQSPTLLIHESCAAIARVFPRVIQASGEPDDIADDPDYAPIRGLMYFAMSRPLPTPNDEPELPPDAIGHWVNEIRSELRSRQV